MSSESDEMSVDYTRWLETTTTALIIGAAIVVSTVFQAEQADTRAARGMKQRSEIAASIKENGGAINALRLDLAKLKNCRPG